MEEALAYIQQHDLNSLPVGRHEINGDKLYVVIADSQMRTAAEAQLEAHNRYIDIQIPLSCAESYGVKARSECHQPIGEFDEEKDIIFYQDAFTQVETRQPGEMIIFQPEDAHAPLLGTGTVHKAIFKVSVTD